MPYPQPGENERQELTAAVAEMRRFIEEKLDPDAIDREAVIPSHTIAEIGRLGVLGMTAPK